MNIVAWLEQIRKLDELIDAKIAEREQVWSRLTSVSLGEQDGMPHAKGNVSDPVGNGVVKLRMLGDEIDNLIDKYVDRKNQVIETLEQLPLDEFGVLHRYYVRYMTIEEIADDMGYSEKQIDRIKKKGLKNLERCPQMSLNVLECPLKM